MKLIEQIGVDFITAFKAREMGKKNFLGVLKSECTQKSKEPTDDEVIAKLKTMVKNHNKALKETGAESLTKEELDIINGYLPQLMSEQAITEIIQQIIVYTGGDNAGKVMGMFAKEHKGKADNKLVQEIIKQELS